MPRRLSAAEIALNQLQERRKREYLDSLRGPGGDGGALITELRALGELAEGDIDPEIVRDEAERAILRWINDEEISEAFYSVRKYCS